MKKIFAFAAMFAAVAMVSCGGQQTATTEETAEVAVEAPAEEAAPAAEATAEVAPEAPAAEATETVAE